MPKIGECIGLKVYMYYEDHPPPHFHIRGSEKASVDFYGQVIEGSLNPKTQRYVRDWAIVHQMELEENWERAVQQLSLNKIT